MHKSVNAAVVKKKLDMSSRFVCKRCYGDSDEWCLQVPLLSSEIQAIYL